MTAVELIALCKEKLGSLKAPKSVDFVESLPRSTVGKVLKKDLRQNYWQSAARKIDAHLPVRRRNERDELF